MTPSPLLVPPRSESLPSTPSPMTILTDGSRNGKSESLHDAQTDARPNPHAIASAPIVRPLTLTPRKTNTGLNANTGNASVVNTPTQPTQPLSQSPLPIVDSTSGGQGIPPSASQSHANVTPALLTLPPPQSPISIPGVNVSATPFQMHLSLINQSSSPLRCHHPLIARERLYPTSVEIIRSRIDTPSLANQESHSQMKPNSSLQTCRIPLLPVPLCPIHQLQGHRPASLKPRCKLTVRTGPRIQFTVKCTNHQDTSNRNHMLKLMHSTPAPRDLQRL
jgi:hypothetical protein